MAPIFGAVKVECTFFVILAPGSVDIFQSPKRSFTKFSNLMFQKENKWLIWMSASLLLYIWSAASFYGWKIVQSEEMNIEGVENPSDNVELILPPRERRTSKEISNQWPTGGQFYQRNQQMAWTIQNDRGGLQIPRRY